MSFLIGSGPDTDTEHRLQQASEHAIAGANAKVPIVDFGQSALGGMSPEGRQAQLGAIQGYQDIINAPGGLDARARAAMMGGQASAEQQSAARTQEIQDMAARRGAASSGEAAAEQAIQEQGAATRGSQAGLQGAALGEEARQAALQGEAGAGGALRMGDVNAARTQDAYTLANKENQQQMLQQQFVNALQQGGAYGSLMSGYDKTKAGGGYGLMANGLLSPENMKGAIQGVAGAMTGGLSTIGTSLLGMLQGGGDGSGELGG